MKVYKDAMEKAVRVQHEDVPVKYLLTFTEN